MKDMRGSKGPRPSLTVLAQHVGTPTFHAVWKALTIEERRRAITCTLAAKDKELASLRVELIRRAAEAKHTRPQTMAQRSPEEIAEAAIRKLDLPEAMLRNILPAWHFAERAELLAMFLDSLGVANVDGHAQAEPGKAWEGVNPAMVARSASRLYQQFSKDAVLIYLITLRIIQRDRVPGLQDWLHTVGKEQVAGAEGPDEEQGRSREASDDLWIAETRLATELLYGACVEAGREMEKTGVLTRQGTVPGDGMVRAYTTLTRKAAELAARLEAEAARLGVELPPNWVNATELEKGQPSQSLALETLTAFMGELGRRRQGAEGVIEASREAFAFLDTLDRLRLVKKAQHPSLEAVRERARVLRQAAGQAASGRCDPNEADTAGAMKELEEVLQGLHPLNALSRLVDNGKDLRDDEVEELDGIVRREFGAPIALAAVRGLLEFAPSPLDPVTARELHDVDKLIGGATAPTSDRLPSLIQPHLEEGSATAVVTPEAVLDGADKDSARVAESASPTVAPDPTVSRADGALLPIPEPLPNALLRSESPLVQGAWGAVGAGLGAAALELIRAKEELDGAGDASLPLWVLECVSLAPYVLDPVGGISMRLQALLSTNDVESYLETTDLNQAIRRLLLAAATFRPALISPSTGAGLVLAGLRFESGLERLWSLSQGVSRFAAAGIPLGPEVLRGVTDRTTWEAQLHDVQQSAEQFLRYQAPGFKMSYSQATDVWRAWLKSEGPVAQLLRPVMSDARAQQNQVSGLIETLADSAKFKRAVNDTDRRELGRRGGKDIHAGALTQLKSRADEAMDISRTWLQLLSMDPNSGMAHRLKQAVELQRLVAVEVPQAIKELGLWADEATVPMLASAARCCAFAVRDLAALFSAETSYARPELTPEGALRQSLLRFPRLRLNADARPAQPAVQAVEAILSADGELMATNPEAAFSARLAAGDFGGAEALLQEPSLEQGGLVNLRSVFSERLSDARRTLRRKVKEVEADVEDGVAFGFVDDGLRSSSLSITTDIDRRAQDEQVLALDLLEERLDDVARRLHDVREAQVAEMSLRLDPFRAGAAHADTMAVQELLEKGDVFTADEYLRRMELGESTVGESTAGASFVTPFLDAVRRFERLETVPALLASMEKALGAQPDSGHVAADAKRRATKQVSSWLNRAGSRGLLQTNFVRDLFEFLGFTSVDVGEITRSGDVAHCIVKTDVVQNRDLCPVPQFGSQARGHYRVVAVWNTTAPQDLGAIVTRLGGSAPVVLFSFNGLGLEVRRRLRTHCRANRLSYIVLDDYLMLFLASLTGGRLGAFFGAALPFSHMIPFHTRAGETPKELFVGRRLERAKLLEANGSCIVYGGRQLGKTALLRDVERTLNEEGPHSVGVYVDLQQSRIGIERPLSDLWDVIAQELRPRRLTDGKPGTADAKMVGAWIRNWLAKDPQRRLILLLDEADRFIELDGNPMMSGGDSFIQTHQLKSLMDATERRFKVVLAGLHNVQRTTRLANHPLAHFGEPICVGPLLSNGEWRDAAALIERPLVAMGYSIAPPLVTRILSQTNYYPNLIQLYGQELLRHIAETQGMRPEPTLPPVDISEASVSEAYRSNRLRDHIRDRFDWTLQLDPRYRVLALVVGYLSFAERGGRDSDGFTSSDIRSQALDFWRDGFEEDPSVDGIHSLCDEMVGLGLLRQTERGAYAFRGANVSLLMGSESDILDKLNALEPPANFRPYTPAVYRRELKSSSTAELQRRSPLTLAQEATFLASQNGVTVLCGVAAGGYGDFEVALKAAAPDKCNVFPATARLDAFRAELLRLRSRDRIQGTTLLLVNGEVPWGEDWVQEALTQCMVRRSSSRSLRVVFIAGPAQLWGLLGARAGVRRELSELGVEFVGARPWHDAMLRHWLEGPTHSAVFAGMVDTVRRASGKWPMLLYGLRERIGKLNPTQAAGALEAEVVNLGQRATGEHLLEKFGLDVGPPVKPLKVLAEFAAFPAVDLRELATPVPEPDEWEAALDWIDLLGLATPGTSGYWEVDPIVSRLVNLT